MIVAVAGDIGIKAGPAHDRVIAQTETGAERTETQEHRFRFGGHHDEIDLVRCDFERDARGFPGNGANRKNRVAIHVGRLSNNARRLGMIGIA